MDITRSLDRLHFADLNANKGHLCVSQSVSVLRVMVFCTDPTVLIGFVVYNT